jgi:hypothetical protein
MPDEVQSTEVQSIATALANREAAWASGNIAVPVAAHAPAQ